MIAVYFFPSFHLSLPTFLLLYQCISSFPSHLSLPPIYDIPLSPLSAPINSIPLYSLSIPSVSPPLFIMSPYLLSPSQLSYSYLLYCITPCPSLSPPVSPPLFNLDPPIFFLPYPPASPLSPLFILPPPLYLSPPV